jgi:hypothetical protein
MSDVKEINVEDVNPVAVGTVVKPKSPPPSLVIKMVNTRASHFYFKRTLGILRALGKYR